MEEPEVADTLAMRPFLASACPPGDSSLMSHRDSISLDDVAPSISAAADEAGETLQHLKQSPRFLRRSLSADGGVDFINAFEMEHLVGSGGGGGAVGMADSDQKGGGANFAAVSMHVQSRLAVSYAIAQSSVLSIFESRIERLVEEYRYIPERLAARGKVKLSSKQLGNMIGSVFVITHDVNLHSEILDTPDYFWAHREAEPVYRLMSDYLQVRVVRERECWCCIF